MKVRHYKNLMTIFSNQKIFLSNFIRSFQLKPDNCWNRWVDENNCGFEINIDTKYIYSYNNMNKYKNLYLINPENIKNVLNYSASILIDKSNCDIWIMTYNFEVYHYKFIIDNYYFNYSFNNDISKLFIYYKFLYRTIFYKKFKNKNIINSLLPIKSNLLKELKSINELSYNEILIILKDHLI